MLGRSVLSFASFRTGAIIAGEGGIALAEPEAGVAGMASEITVRDELDGADGNSVEPYNVEMVAFSDTPVVGP
jgi:hypothetical protein